MNVNFGLYQDYKELAERNVDVRGKIVMARLDTGWRGEKVFYKHNDYDNMFLLLNQNPNLIKAAGLHPDRCVMDHIDVYD